MAAGPKIAPIAPCTFDLLRLEENHSQNQT